MSRVPVRPSLMIVFLSLLLAGGLLLSGCDEETDRELEPIPTAIPTVVGGESAPGAVIAARDAALTFIRSSYEVNLPGMDAAWRAADVTPQDLVGSGAYQFAADTCLVTVSYPIVQPAATIYTVILEDNVQNFRWEGQVDPTGRVTETGLRPQPEVELCVDNRTGTAMSYGEARAIAATGVCAAEGPLTDGHQCNVATGTWWIDLDVEKPGCNPACVVDVNDGAATVNWRCTGLLPPTDEESAAPSFDYDGWVAYRDPAIGYRVLYPEGLEVQAAGDGSIVSFNGPLVENERWPMISISHFQSDFYQPPAAVDLQTWVVQNVPAFDEMDTRRTIAGLPVVHLRTAATPQSYAFDDYYLVYREQLIRILLMHSGGREDWDFYNHFLDSFTLESSMPPIADEEIDSWIATRFDDTCLGEVAMYGRVAAVG